MLWLLKWILSWTLNESKKKRTNRNTVLLAEWSLGTNKSGTTKPHDKTSKLHHAKLWKGNERILPSRLVIICTFVKFRPQHAPMPIHYCAWHILYIGLSIFVWTMPLRSKQKKNDTQDHRKREITIWEDVKKRVCGSIMMRALVTMVIPQGNSVACTCTALEEQQIHWIRFHASVEEEKNG